MMQLTEGCWYEESGQDCANLLKAEAQRCLTEDQGRLSILEQHLRLYGGTKARCIRPWENPGIATAYDVLGADPDALRLNVVKAVIDTVTSKVGKNRPRPTFLTDGGDWSTQVRAKNLQRFMDGAYHQSDVYELAGTAFRDAMIQGTSCLHPYPWGKRIACESVPVWEMFVNRADAMYGKPRCLYRIKWVAQHQVVAELGPKARDAAVDNESATAKGYVRVVEAWCLPCCPVEEIGEYDKRSDAKDYGRESARCNGKHVIIAGDKLVVEEDWAYPEFPFVFIHWSKPVQGFWGDSAISEVAGLQVEINKLLQFIQEAMQKCAQPIVLRHKDAIVSPDEVSNLIGQVWEVSPTTSLDESVKVVVSQAVSPEVMNHLWMLYSKAFEILGSNQLAAAASAPPGLESGRALEQLAEEHSERFMTVSRHFEHCIGELMARQFIRCAKQIDEQLKEDGHKEGYVIRAPNGRATIKLKWADVEIDEDGFIIQVFPTSVLPTTPAARIQEVERMQQAMWIDPPEARRLLDFPDLKASTDLATADQDNLMRQIELMLEQGEQVIPEPYQDLAKAIQIGQQSILRAQIDGVPEEHIDLVRNFITAAEALLKRTMTPNPVPAGTFGAPQAQPTAQPSAPSAPPAAQGGIQ